jgi:hypothetical protein
MGDAIVVTQAMTASIGGLDAAFDPSGNLKALPLFGAYVGYQKYWKRDPRLRAARRWRRAVARLRGEHGAETEGASRPDNRRADALG